MFPKKINLCLVGILSAGCSNVTADLKNRPCDAGECLDGNICDQLSDDFTECVEAENCFEENDGRTIKVCPMEDPECKELEAGCWECVNDEWLALDACPDPLCIEVDCHDHGECSDGECDCTTGWDSNDDCATCDPSGYHPDGEDCVLDGVCETDSCNSHEIVDGCDDSGSTIVCTCQSQYNGVTCDGCDTAAGYVDNYPDCDLDLCVSQTCNGNGDCTDPFTGTCTCINDNLNPTLGVDCGSCKTGWDPASVPTCNTCDPNGYIPDGSGGCMLSPTCQSNSCSFHGSCDDAGGSVVCTCEPAYTGDATCSTCGTGYHWAADGVTCTDDMCDPDPSCDDSLACNGVETCDSVAGCLDPTDVTCSNGGSCTEPSGDCTCTNHWNSATGCTTCEGFWDDIQDCNQCLPNYTGGDCHRDWCADNTCLNGGSCASEACSCVGTWGGVTCDVQLVTAELLGGITYQTMQGSWNTVLYVRATAHGAVTVDGYDHTLSLTDIAPAGTDISNVRIYEGNKVTLISEGASDEVNHTWNSTILGFSFITPKSMVTDETWDYLVEIEINNFSAGDTLTTELTNVRVNTGSNIAVTSVSVSLP